MTDRIRGPALRFLDAATRHGDSPQHERLFQLGYPGLMHRLDIGPKSPPDDEAFHHVQKLYQTMLLEAAREISAHLTRVNIPHVFAKGIALLGPVYQPGDRLMSDVDLYVPIAAKAAAVHALADLRYVPLPERDQSGPDDLRSALVLERQRPDPMERILIDVHWGLDPVERLLPRRERPLPETYFANRQNQHGLPIPHPAYHAAILIHHLVHTDLLHIRSLLDLALLITSHGPDDFRDLPRACTNLRIDKFGHAVTGLLARECDVPDLTPLWPPRREGNRFLNNLTLDRWLSIALAPAGQVDPKAQITPRRIWRRLRTIDSDGTRSIFEDIFLPPEAFLRWRWETDNMWEARLSHMVQLGRKVLRR